MKHHLVDTVVVGILADELATTAAGATPHGKRRGVSELDVAEVEIEAAALVDRERPGVDVQMNDPWDALLFGEGGAYKGLATRPVRRYLADIAFALVANVDSGRVGLALVTVSFSVAPANGIPDVRASIGPLGTEAGHPRRRIALPDGELAELVCGGAVRIRGAGDLARAVFQDRDAGHFGHARVAVGDAIAAANGVEVLEARLRDGRALPAGDVCRTARPGRKFAEFVRPAVLIRLARGAALAAVGDGDTGGVGLTFVDERRAIATADGVPDLGTARWDGRTHADVVAAAGADRKLAKLVGMRAGNPGDAAADSTAGRLGNADATAVRAAFIGIALVVGIVHAHEAIRTRDAGDAAAEFLRRPANPGTAGTGVRVATVVRIVDTLVAIGARNVGQASAELGKRMAK